jgi:serine phosphatase RsbU (regulator of sigma subunit)
MMFYLTSDGFADQPDKTNNKFGSKRLRELMIKLSSENAAEQGREIDRELSQHMAGVKQRDDITLMGIRV